ncbi:hypothetical protein RJ640_014598 [Escallonia rubra]|uniref:Isopenicillin N synthase-like Fe(2+) 2OG dioxygenase domain-containing protein n=1 Tax=Escallonia rubra TaxID=112253 RepID=A0AA88RJQ4_9ASTE|nr:hypothetical protein RJ640_014598 [Escallonia rubra]
MGTRIEVQDIEDLGCKVHMAALAQRLDPFSPEADGVSPQGVTSESNPSFVIGDPMKKVQWYQQPKRDETNIGGQARTDKTFLTIIQQNAVNGLEVETKDGGWMPVEFLPLSFVVMAGEGLLQLVGLMTFLSQGWSNGRVRSPFHRVIMSGNEERYSPRLFTFISGTIDVSEELVDHKHPRQFKPFNHLGFVDFYMENSGLEDEAKYKSLLGVGHGGYNTLECQGGTQSLVQLVVVEDLVLAILLGTRIPGNRMGLLDHVIVVRDGTLFSNVLTLLARNARYHKVAAGFNGIAAESSFRVQRYEENVDDPINYASRSIFADANVKVDPLLSKAAVICGGLKIKDAM